MDAYIAVGRDPAQMSPASQSPTPAQQARAEPAFGQIKQARGFRRFSFRGIEKVRAEWAFVCATHNLLKLFRRGFRPLPAIAQA